ncbi:MAG: MiaB/RimO family radical SAM methylthiotransferase [Armatimonadetes bacterium]|nr:MiaB/RimO family radical SAM methylthiotransferase [Armatimonadota bacterium]
MSFRVALTTLGCKVNQADSDLLAAAFESAGCRLVEPDQPADAYVVNTCTVTLVADRKARKLVRQVAARNESAVVAVTGCYAEGLGRAVLEAMPEVDVVRGTHDRASLPEAVLLELRKRVALGLLRPLDGAPATLEQRVRAMLKIQDGCRQYCAYCIVPSVRGPLTSRRHDDVLAEARDRVRGGVRELVLAGIRLGAFGVDWPDRRGSRFAPLERLVSELGQIENLARVRISSVLPLDCGANLFATMAATPAVCTHLHLPLQAGDDTTLRRMGRGYTTRRFRALVDAARAHLGDLALATDVMVGFPGETRRQFEHTLAFCEAVGFADMHVFSYSPRPGTRAAEWPDDVPPAEKAARSGALCDLRDDLRRRYYERRLGRTDEVLVESHDEATDEVEGLTREYVRVRARVSLAARPALGSLVPMRLVAVEADGMTGELAVGQVVAND